jgi:transposase-like protein
MGAITAEVVETGEKRDTRGRRVATEERRAKMVQAYHGTGLTMAEFARREGLKYATFAGWVAKASRLVPAKHAIKFAEVRVPFRSAPAVPSAPLEVRLADGTSIRGERVAEVAALVRALRS